MRVLLMTGKGGAGTTTCAAATASYAAAAGHKTLLVSMGPDSALDDVCSVTLEADPTELAGGLYAARTGLRRHMPAELTDVQTLLRQTLDVDGGQPTDDDDVASLPVLRELHTLLDVHAQLLAGRWDVVVIDCGPTAEALRMLTLPTMVCRYLETLFSLPHKGLREMPKQSGGELPTQGSALFAAARLHARLRELRDMLANSETSTARLVVPPTPTAVNQARRSLTSLSLHGFAVDRIIVNRVTPADHPHRSSRSADEVTSLERIDESFAPLPVSRLSALQTEPIGVDTLRELGAAIYTGENPLGVASVAPPILVEPRGAGFVLSLALPFATRADVDLVRRSDELVVTVQDERRVLLLPSALRRCVVIGAALTDGRLAIEFEPDRDLWLRA